MRFGSRRTLVPDDHRDILDRAVAGDGQALAQLLEAHAPALRESIESRIPHRWRTVLSADDVMQETYIDAFMDIGRFDPRGEGAFTAWLTTLARRNLLDALRMLEAEKRGRNFHRVQPASRRGSLVALYDQLASPDSTPSRRAARAEAHSCLENALQKLPESYRTVIEMYDLRGEPVEKIAAALHRSVGAVYMRRARAHRQLRDIMGTPSQFLSGTV